MTADRWRRVEEIFHQASEMPAAERAAFVREACAGDAELLQEVESLLDADAAGGSLVEAVIADEAGMLAEQQKQSFIGRAIGPYVILSEIGTGGMGAVYLARRPGEAEVAIKLVRLGMDTDHVLKRFRKESQILAALDHPNIARLLDSGIADDGRPYFAMEYVPGVPVTRYCDTHKLGIRQRLELFTRICEAVEYAHQKLVVHRDLKPTNILVTVSGVPKLLDFGIAKVLIDEAASEPARAMTATLTMMRMMTPDYASPEQVRGEPSSTATDVYSLGIILYELLAGSRPRQFQNATPSEILKHLMEDEVPPPSTAVLRCEKHEPSERIAWQKALQGDLDDITAKAMRLEPSSRYLSVEQLAADIRRYLDGRPVLARQGTLTYYTMKLVRRHRAAIAAGVLAAASLTAGTVASIEQARRAERRFEQLRNLAHHFLFDLYDRLEALPNSVSARELMVRKALEYLDTLRRETGSDPSLELELAMAYQRVGDVLGNPNAPNLGLTAQALDSYRRSIALYESAAGRWQFPRTQVPVASMMQAYLKAGDLLHQSAGSTQAVEFYRKALALEGRLPQDAESHQVRGLSLQRMGAVDLRRGRLREAAEWYSKALTSFETAYALEPGVAVSRRIADCHADAGLVWLELSDHSASLRHLEKARNIRSKLVSVDPGNVLYRRELMNAYLHLGDLAGSTAYINMGQPEMARGMYEQGLKLALELLDQDPQSALAIRDAATAERKMANSYRDSDPRRAVAGCRRSRALAQRLLERDPQNAGWLRLCELADLSLGYALAQAGETAEGIRTIRSSIEQQRALIARDDGRVAVRQDLHDALNYLGDVYLRTNQRELARAAYGEALEIAIELNRRNPSDLYSVFCLATSHERLGAYFARVNDWRAAASSFSRAAEIWRDWNRNVTKSGFTERREREIEAALADAQRKSAAK